MILKVAQNIHEELEFIFKTRCHPDVAKMLFGAPPETFDMHVSYFNKVQGKSRYILIAKEGCKFVGYSQIYDIQDNSLEVGFAVHPDFQGKGLGQKLVSETVKYCLENFKNHKIVLFVKSDNGPGVHIYKKLGFDEFSNDGQKIEMHLNETRFRNL